MKKTFYSLKTSSGFITPCKTLKFARELLLQKLDIGETGTIVHCKWKPYYCGYDIMDKRLYVRVSMLTLKRVHKDEH